jgi:hypothetical protein
MFVGKILGGLDCNVAVAILNDNIASIVAKVFFERVAKNHIIRILYITIDANHYDFYEFRAKITVLRSTVYLLRNSDYCQLGTVPHLNIIVII